MDNLFRLLKLIGGKFIIVEDGKPSAVLMDYQEFQDLAVPEAASRLRKRLEQIERVNEQVTHAQLLDLREEVIQDLPDEIKIEPLD
jgi:hypothetical protein